MFGERVWTLETGEPGLESQPRLSWLRELCSLSSREVTGIMVPSMQAALKIGEVSTEVRCTVGALGVQRRAQVDTRRQRGGRAGAGPCRGTGLEGLPSRGTA